MLNAKNHEREGEIIADAGRVGAVALATNMAGRGIDIKWVALMQIKKWLRKEWVVFMCLVLSVMKRVVSIISYGDVLVRQGILATQFFVSMDDSLMRVFSGGRAQIR